jgi:hypothetical protein|tara:strand:+ start:724 stop:1584 length:861 start_codon:yes stop_codon:yes gene_type:complete
MKNRSNNYSRIGGLGAWGLGGLVLLLVLATIPAQAFALGITPGERVIANEPAKTFEYSGLILNNDGKEMKITLDIEGDLKPYISVEPKTMEFTKDEKQKEYFVQVLVPFSLEEDKNTGYVLATEEISIPKGETIVSAALAVKSRIVIGSEDDKVKVENLERVDLDETVESETGGLTTGLVVGKGSKAGLFQNKFVGVLLLTAGLLIMGGLVLMGVSYQKQASKTAKKKKVEKKIQKQVQAQEQVLALEEYISKCKKQGLSKEYMQRELVKQGWNGAVVKKILDKSA